MKHRNTSRARRAALLAGRCCRGWRLRTVSTRSPTSAPLCRLVALIEAIAILGDRLSGVVATLSAALWFDFFLTPPYERFTISHRPDLETTISILVVGVIVTEVAARSRRHRRAAGEESRFVAMLHDVTELCARDDDGFKVTEYVPSRSSTCWRLRACRFETGISGPAARSDRVRRQRGARRACAGRRTRSGSRDPKPRFSASAAARRSVVSSSPRRRASPSPASDESSRSPLVECGRWASHDERPRR